MSSTYGSLGYNDLVERLADAQARLRRAEDRIASIEAKYPEPRMRSSSIAGSYSGSNHRRVGALSDISALKRAIAEWKEEEAKQEKGFETW